MRSWSTSEAYDTEFVDGGYHSLADALAELQMKGWEPFECTQVRGSDRRGEGPDGPQLHLV